jgi:poly(A) polymerase
LEATGIVPYQSVQQAASEVVSRQLKRVSLPRRFSTPMQEIWAMQARFSQTRGKRPLKLLAHPRFRAAYDFMLLRAASGEADPELAAWWTEFQEGNADAPPPTESGSAVRRSRRGGRRRRRKPAPAGEG